VSFGSTSPALSDRSEFPLFCRTNEEVYSLAVNELVTQLEAANITCAASITFAESDFKEQLQQLKELDTRIIIGSFSQEMIPKIFCEAFKLGMFGAEYAWLVAGLPPRIRGPAPCARTQLARALEGLVSVTAHRGIVGDVTSYSGLTDEMFHREMEASGFPVSPYAPQTYDAVWAIALALAKAEQIWRNTDLGPVSFNGADRIGTNRSGVCKTKLLQDTPLISLVCALLVIDGLIVTLWTMLDPMERHLKNLTIEISATDR
ncbi:Gamma-aminobutyric acid type B receptor subunit 2, partial [Operophtera brumata]